MLLMVSKVVEGMERGGRCDSRVGDRGPDKRNLNERESVRGREWSEVRQLGSGEEWVGCVSVCVCLC